jgi:hypothetical protein
VNSLPQHRRVLLGRTWNRTWSPADYSPIECWRKPIGLADWIVGIVLGVIGAVALVHFIAT